MTKLVLRVDGISCSGCAVDAESALKTTDGILDAKVSYSEGTVHLEYRPEDIDEHQVLGLVKKLGLQVR